MVEINNSIQIFAIIVISILLLIGITILIIKLQHPDDTNTAWLPKLIVLLSLFCACVNVLILPYDVINTQNNAGLDMETLWTFTFYVSAGFLFVLIPFAYFYYENETDPTEEAKKNCWDRMCNLQFIQGIKWSIACAILIIMTIIITYFAAYRKDESDANITDNRANFTEYATAVLSFIGWFMFVIFVGMGLPALPWDLFNEWRFRPQPMSITKYAEEKKKIGKRAAMLKKVGEELQTEKRRKIGKSVSRKEKREFKETLNQFENATYLLKRDFMHLEMAYKKRGGNPFVYWLKLLGAIIGGSISVMWLIHIVLFILPNKPVDPWLNTLFQDLTDKSFPMFGIMTFAIYSFWLLLCVMKGNFRFGLKFTIFCAVFPVEMGGTLLNAFLVNTWLILLSSIVVVQFGVISFPIYTENTAVNKMFNERIMSIGFFKSVFENNIFIYALLIFSLLSIIWLWCFPKNEALAVEKELGAIMKGNKKIKAKQLELIIKS